MSFLKIKDPVKREQMVKDYLVTKKRIHDSLLAEKTGDIELQTDLSKFFRPITKSQKDVQEEATKNIGRYQLEAARRITEGLAPIREGIIQLPVELSKEMKTSQLRTEGPPPSYHKITAEEDEEKIKNFVKVFNIKLADHKNYFDNTFRIVFDSYLEKFKFGKHVISYDPNRKTFSLAENTFPATDGLWELILSNSPKNFTENDLKSYQNLIYLSDIMFKDNDKKKKKKKN